VKNDKRAEYFYLKKWHNQKVYKQLSAQKEFKNKFNAKNFKPDNCTVSSTLFFRISLLLAFFAPTRDFFFYTRVMALLKMPRDLIIKTRVNKNIIIFAQKKL